MDENNISKEKLIQWTKEYLDEANVQGDRRKGYAFHIKRFAKTLEYLHDLPLSFEGNVLDIGGYDAISYIIKQVFPLNTYVNTDVELREGELPYKDNSFDFILNLEIVEHLAEPDCFKKQAFSHYGVKHSLKECFRVLRHEGEMLLTTPNGCSYTVMMKLLKGELPWTYFLHYKEYNVSYIKDLLTDAGFDISFITTEYVYEDEKDFSSLREFILNNNFSLKNRGDIIFALLKKK